MQSEDTAAIRRSLEGLGCTIVRRTVGGGRRTPTCVCVSTAIEDTNPDIAAARARGIPIIHRSDLLAAIIATKRTIAVAGTSGKSTVTAMIFEFLTACGKSPSLISGARLAQARKAGDDRQCLERRLRPPGRGGGRERRNAGQISSRGRGHPERFEGPQKRRGDDGAVRDARPRSAWTASMPTIRSLPLFPHRALRQERFGRAGGRSGKNSARLRSSSFERASNIICRFPGDHNLENLAPRSACANISDATGGACRSGKNYEGVARRFTVTRTKQGVLVVDDFAHNPAKIAAAVSTARGLPNAIIAVYQPHGFGPTRFLKDEYIATFRAIFRQHDSLYLLPIYYAGGTAKKDISSQDMIQGLGRCRIQRAGGNGRDELLARLKADAKPGDCVIVMGARDPSLPALVGKISGVVRHKREIKSFLSERGETCRRFFGPENFLFQ